jgi:ATP-dependent DNA ligase
MKSTIQSIIESFSLSTGSKKSDWIKIKKQLTFDLVVGGYTPGSGQRQPSFVALLLGAYDSDRLISSEFIPSDESQFFHPSSTGDVRWLKPEIVVEVEALEVSKRRHLRAPVFLRTRDDKLPEECTIDQLQTN